MPAPEEMSGPEVAAVNQPPGADTIGNLDPTQMSPDLKKRIMQLAQLQQQKINEQEQMLKGQKETLGAFSKIPVQADLSPLMAYVDSHTGSHLLQGYHQPQTASDRVAELDKLQNEILQRKDQLTDDQQKLLESQIHQMMNEGMADYRGRNLATREQANQRRNEEQAFNAGKAFTHDKINTQLQGTINNLDRGLSMLDNPNVPLTAQSLNVLQQDMVNAFAPGGAATEGKVHRELVEPFAAKLNEINTKFGNVADLRKDLPQIVSQLRSMMQAVKADYQEAMGRQAGKIASTYVGSKNPMLKQVVKTKLEEYGQPEKASSNEDTEALNWAKQNSQDPRAQEILKRLGQ